MTDTGRRRHLKKSDTLWLRLSLLNDPYFAQGVPWNLAPFVFERLESLGLVERITSKRNHSRAVGTPAAEQIIEATRENTRKYRETHRHD